MVGRGTRLSASNGTEAAESESKTVGRRRFLTYLVAAPTLTVAAKLGLENSPAAAAVPSPPQPAEIMDIGQIVVLAAAPTGALGFQLQVNEDGTIDVNAPRAEVGQGLTTAMSMLIAEELDVPVSSIKMALADARPELVFNQLTGASSGVRSVYHPARATAAGMRARLLATAAQQWGVRSDQLSVTDGTVYGPGGQSTTYGALAVPAAKADLPDLVTEPKAESEFRLIGKPTNRVDAREIVTGKHTYTLDLDIAGAMPCMVRRAPTINGTVRAVHNADAVKKRPGVHGVATIPTGVAVVAETFALALEGANALDVSWGPGTVDDESDSTIREKLQKAAPPFVVPPLLTQTLDMEFDFAFATHGAVEMNAAVADVKSDSAEIWGAFQAPIVAQGQIAQALGLLQNQVTCHVVPSGGSFGRRLFHDSALEAAQVSRALDRPVKLLWHRTDDIRHGRVHPAKHHKVRVTHAAGTVLSYEHRVISGRTDIGHGFGEMLTAMAHDIPVAGNLAIGQVAFQTMVHCPYKFGAVTELLHEVPIPMHTGSWRSVWSISTRGVEEILVDEVAKTFGKDPVEFRRESLAKDRQRAVLDKVAETGQWGRSMPTGFAQGFAFHDEMKSCEACLVELDVRDPKHPRVTKAVIAVDVGLPVNPRGIESQMLGGLTDAISLSLSAGLHLRNGTFLEGSYHHFHYARQKDSPPDVQIEVLPPTTGEPGGVGELGLAAPFAAIVNAYSRATGTTPRSFPINFDVSFDPYPPGPAPSPPMQPPPARR